MNALDWQPPHLLPAVDREHPILPGAVIQFLIDTGNVWTYVFDGHTDVTYLDGNQEWLLADINDEEAEWKSYNFLSTQMATCYPWRIIPGISE